MEKDYKNMTNAELEAEQKTIQETFSEYHAILQEVYANMYELATQNDEIKAILKQRNGE